MGIASNQYTPDPREEKCWNLYIQSISDGVPNAYKAAMESGYSNDHSRNITLQGWFKGRSSKLKRKDMLTKAEKVLENTLEMNDEEEVIINGESFGIKKRVPALTKIKQDTAKFLAERLGKNEGYATRTEHTGKDGDPIALSVEKTEEISKAIDEL